MQENGNARNGVYASQVATPAPKWQFDVPKGQLRGVFHLLPLPSGTTRAARHRKRRDLDGGSWLVLRKHVGKRKKTALDDRWKFDGAIERLKERLIVLAAFLVLGLAAGVVISSTIRGAFEPLMAMLKTHMTK